MVGIYSIKNTVNNKVYVGLSTKMGRRFSSHKRRLKDGTHENKHLQCSFNKYGKKAFEFIILEECIESMLFEKEKFWIAKLNTCNSIFGYNKTHGGEFGRLHSDIYKRYAKLYKDRPISDEQKKKISETLTGSKHPKDVCIKRGLSIRKLSLLQEELIKRLLTKGKRITDIARLYDVNINTIRGIVNRNFKGSMKKWRNRNQIKFAFLAERVTKANGGSY